jgi:hypothetical protein
MHLSEQISHTTRSTYAPLDLVLPPFRVVADLGTMDKRTAFAEHYYAVAAHLQESGQRQPQVSEMLFKIADDLSGQAIKDAPMPAACGPVGHQIDGKCLACGNEQVTELANRESAK